MNEAFPLALLGRAARDKLTGALKIQGGGRALTVSLKDGGVAAVAPGTVDGLAAALYPLLAADDARADFSAQAVGGNVLLPGERALIAACETLAPGDIVRFNPAFGEDEAGISLPRQYEKEIPALPVSPEELGLIKVVLHNPTLKDVLGASFLGRERILRLLFAYHLLDWVFVVGSKEKALRDLLAALTPEQRAARERLAGLASAFAAKNYFEWLGLPPYTGTQEIQTATQRLMETCLSPATERLFVPDERPVLRALLAQLEEVRGVLTHPAKRGEYTAFAEKGGKGSFLAQNQGIHGIDAVANALKLERAGDKENAARTYEDALRAAPESVDLLSGYATALLRMHGGASVPHQKRALGLLKTLLEKHPQHAATYVGSIAWLKATGQAAKAFEFAKKGLSLHPSHPAFRGELLDGGHADGPRAFVEQFHPLLPRLNHYQILGLVPQASAEDVRRAYRALSKALHPDRFFRDDPAAQARAKDLYKRIVQAHGILKDSDKKREYDRMTFNTRA